MERLELRQALGMRQELEAVRAKTLGELERKLNDDQLNKFKRMWEERNTN